MEYILSHLQIYDHYVTLICTTLHLKKNAKKMTKNNMTPAKQNGQVNR